MDVLTIDPGKSEFEDESFRMPVLLDLGNSESEDEMVEVGPGTMRRRSPGEGKEWMNGTGSGDETSRVALNGTSKPPPKRRR